MYFNGRLNTYTRKAKGLSGLSDQCISQRHFQPVRIPGNCFSVVKTTGRKTGYDFLDFLDYLAIAHDSKKTHMILNSYYAQAL